MKSNLASADRIFRLLAAVIIAVLLVMGVVAINTTAGIILAAVAVILGFTGVVNWCGLYQLLGISTKSSAA